MRNGVREMSEKGRVTYESCRERIMKGGVAEVRTWMQGGEPEQGARNPTQEHKLAEEYKL